MAVIVHQLGSTARKYKFTEMGKASTNTPKACKPLLNVGVGQTLVAGDNDSSRCVQHVVCSGHVQVDRERRRVTWPLHEEVGHKTLSLHIINSIIGVFRKTVGDYPPRYFWQHVAHHQVIDTQHSNTVEGQVVQKLKECSPQNS